MRNLQILENLTRVKRYAGLLTVKDESVSDHVWCMITLALEYIPQLNSRISDENKFEIKDVIYAIALHDIDEALTTDLPRPFKHHDKDIETAISNTVNAILTDKLGSKFVDELHRIEDMSTGSGYLLKIIDVAQCGFKMISEIKLGNDLFKMEIRNVINTLIEFQDDLDEESPTIPDDVRKSLMWLCGEFLNHFYVI